MLSSLIISGGTQEERLEKAVALIPFEINPEQKKSLLELKTTTHADIYLILPENSIGIAQIKDIGIKISLKPSVADKKVIIVDEAEKMTIEAQNAFLKTLEEPPGYVLFILLSSDSDLLLPTITSRCRLIRLSAKSKEYSTEELEKHEKQITKLLNSRVGERLEITADIAKTRDEAILWLEKTIHIFRKVLLRHCENPAMAGDEVYPVPNGAGAIYSFASASQLLFLIRTCNQTKSLLEKNINVRLALDNLLLQWPQ